MEVTLVYIALQGWYWIGSVIIANLLSGTDKQQNTHMAQLLHLQHVQQQPFFCPISQQAHHLSNMHVCKVCRWIKLSLLGDVSVDNRNHKYGQLILGQIEVNLQYKVSGLELGYDQNVLLDCTFNTLHNGLFYNGQAFHSPISVESLGLEYKVQYTNANHTIIPKSHSIRVQYTDTEQKKLNIPFEGWMSSFLVLYISLALLNQILHLQ